jgi:hypothetical protein
MTRDGRLVPLSTLGGTERPLGAALVCSLNGSILDGLANAFREHAVSPWCPLVLAAPIVICETALQQLCPAASRTATILLEHEGTAPTHDEVRAAVGRRGRPTHADITDYVRLRTDEGLARAVERALEGSVAWSAGLRRYLGRMHVPSPQHWFNVFHLTRYLASAADPESRTLEQVALEFNRAPRTLSSWCAKYLRCSWPEARRRLGWEWMVEAVLREIPRSPLRP